MPAEISGLAKFVKAAVRGIRRKGAADLALTHAFLPLTVNKMATHHSSLPLGVVVTIPTTPTKLAKVGISPVASQVALSAEALAAPKLPTPPVVTKALDLKPPDIPSLTDKITPVVSPVVSPPEVSAAVKTIGSSRVRGNQLVLEDPPVQIGDQWVRLGINPETGQILKFTGPTSTFQGDETMEVILGTTDPKPPLIWPPSFFEQVTLGDASSENLAKMGKHWNHLYQAYKTGGNDVGKLGGTDAMGHSVNLGPTVNELNTLRNFDPSHRQASRFAWRQWG
jgi:hypothetical protein